MDGHYRHSLGDFAYGLTLGEMGCEIEVVDFFVGLCDDNPADGTWRDPKIPRKKRIQMKWSEPKRDWGSNYLYKSYDNSVFFPLSCLQNSVLKLNSQFT